MTEVVDQIQISFDARIRLLFTFFNQLSDKCFGALNVHGDSNRFIWRLTPRRFQIISKDFSVRMENVGFGSHLNGRLVDLMQ